MTYKEYLYPISLAALNIDEPYFDYCIRISNYISWCQSNASDGWFFGSKSGLRIIIPDGEYSVHDILKYDVYKIMLTNKEDATVFKLRFGV